MSIVQELIRGKINISEFEMSEEILKYPELTAIDLWLLPQEPFNAWRKKYDYPNLLENIKSNQWRFKDWMQEQNLTDDLLIDGYVSSFLKHKVKSEDPKYHVVRVSTAKKTSIQVWWEYDEDDIIRGRGIDYEYIQSFISYYDWCIIQGKEIDLLENCQKYDQASSSQQVYLNLNYPLLQMGGIDVPVNAVGVLLRGKMLEFVNLSGLKLKDEIHFGEMGVLSFDHCVLDNVECNFLNFSSLQFYYSSIMNIQIRNSNLYHWDLINSVLTGNILDSKLNSFCIFGGQFIPNFINSEINNISIDFKGLPHSKEFEKTYRVLSRCLIDAGNDKESKRLKLLENEFIRLKQNKFERGILWINKIFWGYGLYPTRIIWHSLFIIFAFGLFYSFFPSNIGLNPENSYVVDLFDSFFYSILTFVTMSYGSLFPSGFVKWFAVTEAFLGLIFMGFLIAGLTKSNR